MMVAKKVDIYCPNCEKEVTHYTQIALTEDFKIIVWGTCCGHDLVSPPMDILSRTPHKGDKEKTH